MKKIFLLGITAIFCFTSFVWRSTGTYTIQSSSVSFLSSANFEKIKGASTELKGTVDVQKHTFSFALPSCSFQGFINAQQKKHYCDKFVEGAKYPELGFKGKIIEDIDLAVPGTYKVRGKGMLLLHGIEKERIIDTQVIVKDGLISIDSKFSIPLEDHGIKISKMNSLAISRIVDVAVKITLKQS